MTTKIGITGGIGSGKSVVAHLLKVMGVPVYIADDEAKRITSTDAEIRQKLISLLGEEVFAYGVLNKPLLAAYLFSDPQHASIVNGIIHPKVKEDFINWVSQNQHCPFVAIESAILIEAGFTDAVDIVVMVHAPLELRLKRLLRRDFTLSEEQIRNRIQSQMDDEAKRKMADFVIVNDDITPVIPQLITLMNSASF
ncbi:dephospho-CoA kinase [Bacteroides sedimenti]|uniref:Dephospho-CoA kinase n=1 Tax=Bacteroides sedimenti TaxID=2136147 RepID=A0ABN6Z3J8_9BACE